MNELNDRISLVIEACKITKTAFAQKLNVSQAFVSQLCSGVKQPSNRTILDICKEFHVNEIWLRTGEGEMFKERSPSDEIGYYVEDLLEYEGHGNFFYDMIIEMMKKYHDLDDKSQIVIQEYFKSAAQAALEREKDGD